MVESSMRSPVHQFKVFWAVVKRITVDMMCYFARCKFSTKFLFQNKAVFILPAVNSINLCNPIQIISTLRQSTTSDRFNSRMIQTTECLTNAFFPKVWIAWFVKTILALARIPESFSILAWNTNDRLPANATRLK